MLVYKLVPKELEVAKKAKKKEENNKDLRSQIMSILQERSASGSVSGVSASPEPASRSSVLKSILKKSRNKY